MPGTAALDSLTVGEALIAEGIERAEAGYLLRAATGMSLAQLIAHPERRLDAARARRFLDLARRRREGEPVAYLTGRREFYGLDFEVTPAVLIPRAETELVVDTALRCLPEGKRARVLDLGTGSGAIGLAIAVLRPEVDLVAVDAAEEALAVARRNCERLVADRGRVRLLKGDWFGSLAQERFDLIVANPPYVAHDDPHLEQGDLRFEPREALTAGPDGLVSIRHIIEHSPRHLSPGGWLLLEHGYDQADACRALLDQAGFSELVEEADLAGQPRVCGGKLTAG
jgi:release factor glutamine methyltransferase